MTTWIPEVQVSPSGRYISAVRVNTKFITVALFTASEDACEEISWATSHHAPGIVDRVELVENKPASSYHRPEFMGPGWSRSGRYCAFSVDEKVFYAPGGTYDLATGAKSPAPTLCSDSNVECSTWSFHGSRIACIRSKMSLEVYENNGRLVSAFYNGPIAESRIADFSKSGRYLLLFTPTDFH